MLCFYISGCSLLFEPNEVSVSKIETYDQLVDATGGVYGQFSKAINSFDYNFIDFNSDDLYLGNSSPYSSYYGYKCLDESSNFGHIYLISLANTVYISLYKVIASINNILSQYNIESEKNNEVKAVLGEMYFLRAYCYFHMVRIYGQIPIVSNADVCYTIEKPTFTEIYEFIESDLNQSIKFLPVNNESCRIKFETPHRGTAKALFAEVYLSWAGYPAKDRSKYALAASIAQEVMDSAGFYGFGLEPDFVNLWNKNGKYTNESVFSVYNGRLNYNEESYLYVGTCTKRLYSGYSHQGFTTNNISFLSVRFNTEVSFYNHYPRGYRRDITFFNNIYVPDDDFIVHTPPLDTGYFYIDQVDACSRVAYRKFYLDTLLIPSGNNGNFSLLGNPRICLSRYARTLLTYAEAIARSGSLNEEAYECVNKIRRRANHVNLDVPSVYDLQPGLSHEAFADSVFTERGWELAGEPDGRWFDLLRMERLDAVLNSTLAIENNFFYEQNMLINYFLPIPERDKELSPNWED
jgi:hypothetical protein